MVPQRGTVAASDRALLDAAYALPTLVRAALKDFALHQMLADVWQVIGEANRYFAAEEPWIKRKTDPARMEAVLYTTAETLRVVGLLLQPFMPRSMDKLLTLCGVAPNGRDFAAASAEHRLQSGTPLPPPAAIFPRYIDPDAPAEPPRK